LSSLGDISFVISGFNSKFDVFSGSFICLSVCTISSFSNGINLTTSSLESSFTPFSRSEKDNFDLPFFSISEPEDAKFREVSLEISALASFKEPQ